MEVKSGKGSDAGWGRLKSGAGWIYIGHDGKNIGKRSIGSFHT